MTADSNAMNSMVGFLAMVIYSYFGVVPLSLCSVL